MSEQRQAKMVAGFEEVVGGFQNLPPAPAGREALVDEPVLKHLLRKDGSLTTESLVSLEYVSTYSHWEWFLTCKWQTWRKWWGAIGARRVPTATRDVYELPPHRCTSATFMRETTYKTGL
jgi:hypothetical protein